MRIGFDVTPLTVAHSGVARYTSELLAALQTVAPDNEYHPLAHRSLEGSQPSNRPPQHVFARGGAAYLAKLTWMQLILPWSLDRAEFDVCHFTNYLAPIVTSVPRVVNFYDMGLFVVPRYHLKKRVAAIRPLLPLIARRAAAVVTISESSRQQILKILGVQAERVHVVYGAATPEFGPIADERHLTTVRARYDLPPRFLLYVGTIEPRKNLIRLVEALRLLQRRGLRLPLVIVGQLGWKYKGLFACIEALELRDSVRFLGYVPDADLPALFNLASVFVFPSLYEGFGFPVVEAMACGVPVVTSAMTATAEIAGDAAVLVDPRQSGAIEEGIAMVLEDAALRERLRAAGPERAGQFSWETAARQTTAIYRSLCPSLGSRT